MATDGCLGPPSRSWAALERFFFVCSTSWCSCWIPENVTSENARKHSKTLENIRKRPKTLEKQSKIDRPEIDRKQSRGSSYLPAILWKRSRGGRAEAAPLPRRGRRRGRRWIGGRRRGCGRRRKKLGYYVYENAVK